MDNETGLFVIITYTNNSNILSLIGEIHRFNGKGPTLSGMFTSQGDKGTPVIVTTCGFILK